MQFTSNASQHSLDHCFCCGIQFAKSIATGPRDWPGVVFMATGNWGSTVFDPPDEGPLEALCIRICDRCVLDRRDRIQVVGDSLASSLPPMASDFFSMSQQSAGGLH